MIYAYEDRSLPDALDLLRSRGRDPAFTEGEMASMATALARRTLATAAIGETLPDRRELTMLRACLPDSRGRWRKTESVLSLAVLAVADGAPISRYTPASAAKPDAATSRPPLPADIGQRIVSPDLLPAVTAPDDDLPYPVLIEDDRTFSWDEGTFRFNQSAGTNTRLRNANLRLLSRDLDLSFDGLVGRSDGLLAGDRRDYSSVMQGYNALADQTPFMERARRGILPTVDPAAVFVDYREM